MGFTCTIIQQEFDLRQAFPKNWPKVKVGRWSITNIGYLKCFWGNVGISHLFILRTNPSFLAGYPCGHICECKSFFNDPVKWNNHIGPHICSECSGLYIVKIAKHADLVWLVTNNLTFKR